MAAPGTDGPHTAGRGSTGRAAGSHIVCAGGSGTRAPGGRGAGDRGLGTAWTAHTLAVFFCRGVWATEAMTFELQVGAEAAPPGRGWGGAARKRRTRPRHKASSSQSEARPAVGARTRRLDAGHGWAFFILIVCVCFYGHLPFVAVALAFWLGERKGVFGYDCGIGRKQAVGRR